MASIRGNIEEDMSWVLERATREIAGSEAGIDQ